MSSIKTVAAIVGPPETVWLVQPKSRSLLTTSITERSLGCVGAIETLENTHAPLAQSGMLCAHSDSGPVVPAPLALGMGRVLGRDGFRGGCGVGDNFALRN